MNTALAANLHLPFVEKQGSNASSQHYTTPAFSSSFPPWFWCFCTEAENNLTHQDWHTDPPGPVTQMLCWIFLLRLAQGRKAQLNPGSFDCREVAGLWQPFTRLQMINSLFWAQQNTTPRGIQGKGRWEAVVRWRKEEEKKEENNSALHNYSQQQGKQLAAAASTALHVTGEQWPARRPPQSSQHLQHFTLKKACTFVFPNPTTSHRSLPSDQK